MSAAYYALFHTISLGAARHLLPPKASQNEIWSATRWIEHHDIRSVCMAVSTCAGSHKPVEGLPKGLPQRAAPIWEALSTTDGRGERTARVPAPLMVVSIVFVVLSTARQSADYDHAAEFSKQTTIGHVREAEFAMESLQDNLESPAVQRFFAWIFARASGFRI